MVNFSECPTFPLKVPKTFIKYIFSRIKKLYCTEDEFTSNCQTGDILLFEDEHFFAKAQRFILNADYGIFNM